MAILHSIMGNVYSLLEWYIGNLNTICTFVAAVYLITCTVQSWWRGGVKELGGDYIRDVIPKILGVITLPVVPALLIGAFSSELLAKMTGMSVPLIVAAAALLWASFQPFNK